MGSRIGSITFGGLSSGFPTDEIVERILELERRPIDLLSGQKEDFEEKLAIFQDLNSKSTSFRDTLRGLDNMNLVGTDRSAFEEFRQLAATSSNESIATAAAGGNASRGSLLIRVDQLAQQERELSAGYTTATDAVGTGNFTIDVAGAGPASITIDPTNNSVEGFVQAINDAELGVTAFVVNDGGASGTPFHIAVVGNESGQTQTITIDTSGLSGGTAPTFTETQSAQDAQITLDPGSAAELAIASSSNTFSDVLGGVSISVLKADPSSFTIDVKHDSDAVVDQISDLVTSYNEIVEIIQEQAKVDATTNRGGPLLGDSTLISLKQRLATVFSSIIGTGDLTTASQAGLSLGRDGVLQLDETKLRERLASDFDGAAAFFAGPGSFSDQLRTVLDTYVDPVDGLLVTRINGTNQSISDLEQNITDAEDRLVTIEEQLIQQFAGLERTISRLQQQGNFLAQFLLAQSSS